MIAPASQRPRLDIVRNCHGNISNTPNDGGRMTQTTATEKDMYLQTLQRECETAVKVLKAYPATQGDFKPHERPRTAKELAWNFLLEPRIAQASLNGRL